MHSLWMVAASLFFACMSLFVKLGSERFSSAELVFYRCIVAFLLILAFVLWRRLPVRTRWLKVHLSRSLAGFASMVLYFHALGRIPLATAVTLGYTSSLFIAVLVVLWWREPVRPAQLVALAAGFIGVALLMQPSLNREQWLPASMGLCSGLLSAIAFLNVRKLGRLGEPEWRMVFYFSLFSSIAGLPWAINVGTLHALDWRGGLLLLGIGVFGVCGQICMAIAYMRGNTLVTANLSYSTLVFSSLFGIALWGEILPPQSWLGMALIVGSGIWVTALSRATPTKTD